MLLKIVEQRWDFFEESRTSQAVFLITNVRFGRHVNVSQDECKKSRIEIRLSDLVYSFGGSKCTERNEGTWFFFPRLKLVHFGSAVGEGVDLR